METTKMLVLTKDHKPIGTKNIIEAGGLMYFIEETDDAYYIHWVKPITETAYSLRNEGA